MDNTSERESEEPAGHVVVVGQWRQGHARLPLPYVQALRNAGADARVFSTFSTLPAESGPPDLQVSAGLDPEDASAIDNAIGLLLPGGGDIDPSLYGEQAHPKAVGMNRRRDEFELTLLAAALEKDLPVLAICHGMQLLNVHLGGSLEQHLSDRPGRLEHNLPHGPDPVHEVEIEPDTEVALALGADRAEVNSSHHQGLAQIAPGLSPVAWAEDGVLEAVVSQRHGWVVGVQWHPELMAADHSSQQGLFDSFVNATQRLGSRPTIGVRSE